MRYVRRMLGGSGVRLRLWGKRYAPLVLVALFLFPSGAARAQAQFKIPPEPQVPSVPAAPFSWFQRLGQGLMGTLPFLIAQEDVRQDEARTREYETEFREFKKQLVRRLNDYWISVQERNVEISEFAIETAILQDWFEMCRKGGRRRFWLGNVCDWTGTGESRTLSNDEKIERLLRDLTGKTLDPYIADLLSQEKDRRFSEEFATLYKKNKAVPGFAWTRSSDLSMVEARRQWVDQQGEAPPSPALPGNRAGSIFNSQSSAASTAQTFVTSEGRRLIDRAKEAAEKAEGKDEVVRGLLLTEIQALGIQFDREMLKLSQAPFLSRIPRAVAFGKHLGDLRQAIDQALERIQAIKLERYGGEVAVGGVREELLILRVLILSGPLAPGVANSGWVDRNLRELNGRIIETGQYPPFMYQLEISPTPDLQIESFEKLLAFRYISGLVLSRLLYANQGGREGNVQAKAGSTGAEIQFIFPRTPFSPHGVSNPLFFDRTLMTVVDVAKRYGFLVSFLNRPDVPARFSVRWLSTGASSASMIELIPPTNIQVNSSRQQSYKIEVIEAGGRIFIWNGGRHGDAFADLEEELRRANYFDDDEEIASGSIEMYHYVPDEEDLKDYLWVAVYLDRQVLPELKGEIRRILTPVFPGLKLKILSEK